MLKLLRANLWWNSIVPQVLGWVYFSILWFKEVSESGLTCYQTKPEFSVFVYAAFFIALIGISSFGYLFNDWCDIESDAAAGKKNSLSGYSAFWGFAIVLTPLFLGSCSWVLLQKELQHRVFHIGNLLFLLQLILLIIYSLPPFRLKNRSEWGVLADAIYGHLNPVFVTLSTFLIMNYDEIWPFLFLLALLLICSIKGIRNILLHQVADRRNDFKAGIHTAVLKFGSLRVLNFINCFLLPTEFFFLILLVFIISFRFPPFIVSFLLFIILSYFKFSGWKLDFLPQRQLKFKFLHFLNDYYEGWVPVFFLVILSARQNEFLFLLILHLIIFPSFVVKLWNDLKTIRGNFKTEEEY